MEFELIAQVRLVRDVHRRRIGMSRRVDEHIDQYSIDNCRNDAGMAGKPEQNEVHAFKNDAGKYPANEKMVDLLCRK